MQKTATYYAYAIGRETYPKSTTLKLPIQIPSKQSFAITDFCLNNPKLSFNNELEFKYLFTSNPL